MELLRDERDQLAQLKSPTFDPEKSVILAEVPPSFDFQAESGDDVGSQNGEISFGNSSINEGRFRVFNTRPGFLIISQIFYPGWLAIVDGKEERPLRVDYTFVGVPLSKGTHTIDLVFRPMSFKIGLALSVTSLLVLGSLLIFSPRPQPTQKIP
jgi:hypothetical protein